MLSKSKQENMHTSSSSACCDFELTVGMLDWHMAWDYTLDLYQYLQCRLKNKTGRKESGVGFVNEAME